MKLEIKYDILTIISKKNKPDRHFMRSININLIWKFMKLKIKILRGKIDYFKYPLSKWNNKFKSELLPHSHRKKNKLTWIYKLRFFMIEIEYTKIVIVRKNLYRKYLKRKGWLNNA